MINTTPQETWLSHDSTQAQNTVLKVEFPTAISHFLQKLFFSAVTDNTVRRIYLKYILPFATPQRQKRQLGIKKIINVFSIIPFILFAHFVSY